MIDTRISRRTALTALAALGVAAAAPRSADASPHSTGLRRIGRRVTVLGGGMAGLTAEHGFRLFPGFYQHIPDTMRRIPFPGNPNGVFDNLVAGTAFRMAVPGSPDLTAPASIAPLVAARPSTVSTRTIDIMGQAFARNAMGWCRPTAISTGCCPHPPTRRGPTRGPSSCAPWE